MCLRDRFTFALLPSVFSIHFFDFFNFLYFHMFIFQQKILQKGGEGGLLIVLLDTERFCLDMQSLKGIYFIDLSR
jgi:hypothetical protein